MLRIGELAKAVNLPTSTIRFWTNEGLLKVAKTTAGGYRWYSVSSIERVERIKALQTKRRTLDEIKEIIA